MEQSKQNNEDKKEHDQPVTKPDPETLHKTDPQENMKGPISSAMNSTREKFEEKGDEVPAEKDNSNEDEKY